MKINRTQSPFQGSTEPLDQKEAEESGGARSKEGFVEALSQLEAQLAASGPDNPTGEAATSQQVIRSALAAIANHADLGNPIAASTAVRESAQCLIKSRLGEKFQRTDQGKRLVDGLSDYVATTEPFNAKLLSILKRLKAV